MPPSAASPSTDIERLCIDTVRALAMDIVQQANSGHPGMPMAMAPAAYVLYREILNHDPRDPGWPDRDRFVLSAGHGSAWIYAALHLSGYDLPMEQLEKFRQWGSLTPGHPERDPHHVTPGVEVTTGPLGQGFANGVGLAMAEAFLRDRFGAEVQNHHTYAICSDGDLMEGIASEAASIAGQKKLGKLVYLYDDNDISLDGPTSLSFNAEDVTKRFEAYGWDVSVVEDVNDVASLRAAVEAARDDEERPSLIRVKTVIGYPAPNKQGTSKAHGAPLGDDEVRAAKEALGLDPDQKFHVSDEVYAAFSAQEKGTELRTAWEERFKVFGDAQPELAREWDAAWAGKPLPGVGAALADIDWGDKPIATRSAGQKAMAAFESVTPTMVGGAADLSESTKTEFPNADEFTAEKPGRNVFWGVREHGMAGAVNGLAAHGGIVRPYGSTFLQFADYMRGSVRLSALQRLPVAWVWTHDSIALGEDGPTHQPVEHLAALRAIPNLTVLRPADATETAEAWRVILEELDGPAALILSRQNLPVLDRRKLAPAADVARGAYALTTVKNPVASIVATGAEVHTAIAAQALLDIPVQVVSMPSWELFEAQDEEYQQRTLPVDLPTVSVEAGISMGWDRYSDAQIAVDKFGASAPAEVLLQEYGITAEATAAAVKELLS
ncbi:MAG: transketolase [Solirubrobacteraceae bacterium]